MTRCSRQISRNLPSEAETVASAELYKLDGQCHANRRSSVPSVYHHRLAGFATFSLAGKTRTNEARHFVFFLCCIGYGKYYTTDDAYRAFKCRNQTYFSLYFQQWDRYPRSTERISCSTNLHEIWQGLLGSEEDELIRLGSKSGNVFPYFYPKNLNLPPR